MEYEIDEKTDREIVEWRSETPAGTSAEYSVESVFLSADEKKIVLLTKSPENGIMFLPTVHEEFEIDGEKILMTSKPEGMRYLTAIMRKLLVTTCPDVGEFLPTIADHTLTITHDDEKGRYFEFSYNI